MQPLPLMLVFALPLPTPGGEPSPESPPLARRTDGDAKEEGDGAPAPGRPPRQSPSETNGRRVQDEQLGGVR